MQRISANVLALVLLSGAMIQTPMYQRTPGMIVRYRHQVSVQTDILMGVRRTANASGMKGRFAVRFFPRDSAVANYDSITITLTANGRTQTRPENARTRRLHPLRFPANGKVVHLDAQTGELVDPVEQDFAGFFISLPARPLRVGVAWTDTVRIEAREPQALLTGSATRQYRVTGDTTVLGVKAHVIQFTVTGKAAGSGIAQGSTMSVKVELSETGTAMFAVAQGLLLSRRARGQIRGDYQVTLPSATTMSHVTKYESTGTIIR